MKFLYFVTVAFLLSLENNKFASSALSKSQLENQRKKSGQELVGGRDGTLASLADLLNRNSNLFQSWNGSQSNIETFLELLHPWLVADVSRPISPASNVIAGIEVPSKIDVASVGALTNSVELSPPTSLATTNCANPKYSSVLSGQPLSKPRVIVDFIPFGYDVDKLLIRFYESYKTVDAFVIYECPYSLIGLKKPMYFQMARKAGLFKPFMDKVIYLFSTEKDVEPALTAMRQAISRGDTKFGKGDLFGVELFMAKEMIILFKNFLYKKKDNIAAGNPEEAAGEAVQLQKLRLKILEGLTTESEKGTGKTSSSPTALGIQNDGDEIVVKKVLEHLKYCEIRPEVTSIYTPCMSFKSNFYWLQRTRDMDCFQGTDEVDQRIQKHLKKYMWRLGPYLWPLQSMMDANHNLRRVYHNLTCQHHMGLGSASHMSATNDPVEYWLKQCGTTENRYTCQKAVTKEMLQAGREKKITPALIFNSTIFPWCHKNNYAIHVTAVGHKHRSPFYKEDTDTEYRDTSIFGGGRQGGTLWRAESTNDEYMKSSVLMTSKKLALECVKGSIPWVVTKEPASFPFLMPFQDNPTTGLFGLCSKATWANCCKDGVHRTKEGHVIELNDKALLFFPWSIDAL